MTDLVDTTEMYLRTILELEEEHLVPLRARIAERLGHSGPTVSQTVARMERDGLVIVKGDRHLEFTPRGRARAIRVMRKHRLAERLLCDVIHLDWALVHDEACRWEHVMSADVEKRLVSLLDEPTESPYGNPIPGLTELGEPAALDFMHDVVSLTTALEESHEHRAAGTLRRIGEPIQYAPGLLAEMKAAGLQPGTQFAAAFDGSKVRIDIDGGGSLLWDENLAGHLYLGVSDVPEESFTD